jgi:hypothetical protein
MLGREKELIDDLAFEGADQANSKGSGNSGIFLAAGVRATFRALMAVFGVLRDLGVLAAPWPARQRGSYAATRALYAQNADSLRAHAYAEINAKTRPRALRENGHSVQFTNGGAGISEPDPVWGFCGGTVETKGGGLG